MSNLDKLKKTQSKKELSAKIESKENEISEFTRTKEPKELWDKFERMYK